MSEGEKIPALQRPASARKRNDRPGPNRTPCKARRTNGEPCGRWAVRGLEVCPTHGGASARAKDAAARRVQEYEIRRSMENKHWGRLWRGEYTPEIDPTTRLLSEIAFTAGYVDFLREQLAEVPDGDLTYGVTRTVERETPDGTMTDVTYEAKPHILIGMHTEERDRLARLCELAHKVGVETKVAEAASTLGTTMLGAVTAAMSAAGLDQREQARLREALSTALRDQVQ